MTREIAPKGVLENNIDEIMDEFDFEKVHDYMKFVKWTWVTSQSKDYVPSIEELCKCAKTLLTTCKKQYLANGGHKVRSSSGGFTACINKRGDMRLCFMLAEYEAYGI